MINTLLNCLLYAVSPQPKSKWTHVHDYYFSVFKVQPSYREWHKNRWHLYKIMDREFKGENGDDPNPENECGNRSNDVNRNLPNDIGAKNQNLVDPSRWQQDSDMIGQFRVKSNNLNCNNGINFNPRSTEPQNFNPQTQNNYGYQISDTSRSVSYTH